MAVVLVFMFIDRGVFCVDLGYSCLFIHDIGDNRNADIFATVDCSLFVINQSDSLIITSPIAAPPIVVAIKSLMDGGSFSNAISHIKLPHKVYNNDVP